MAKIPVVSARAVVQALQRGGFQVHHQTGAHVHLRHPDRPERRVVIPYHSGDLAPKTLKSILAQAGLNADDLLMLL